MSFHLKENDLITVMERCGACDGKRDVFSIDSYLWGINCFLFRRSDNKTKRRIDFYYGHLSSSRNYICKIQREAKNLHPSTI